jgi:hypothetical protein
MVRTPAGLPITCALANPQLDEHQVLMAVLTTTQRAGRPTRTADHRRQGIADKGHVSRELDRSLAERGTRLPRTPSTA